MSVSEPDSMKKQKLLVLFNESVRAHTYAGEERLEKALDEARAAGITEDDLGWLEQLASDPEKFWAEYGDDAIPEDLQAVMYMVDGMTMPGWPARYNGFYPKMER